LDIYRLRLATLQDTLLIMSDQELTETEFVLLIVDIHDGAKRSSCTETSADKIKEQATNITRGTQYSKLFETLHNPLIHVNTATVNDTNIKVAAAGGVDITLNIEGFSHRKP